MGVLATDDFNRADATGLGANWTAAGTSLDIASNAAASPSAGGFYCNRYTAVSAPADQYSQAVSGTLSGAIHGVAARFTNLNNSYMFGVNPNSFGGATTTRVWKIVAGAETSLGTGSTTAAAGQTWYLEVQGTSLVAKVNGATEISVTDSSHASGDFGLYTYCTSAAARFDDWEGGDFAASGHPTMRRWGGTPSMTPGPQSFGRGW